MCDKIINKAIIEYKRGEEKVEEGQCIRRTEIYKKKEEGKCDDVSTLIEERKDNNTVIHRELLTILRQYRNTKGIY